MVEASTIAGIVIALIIVGIVGYVVYRRMAYIRAFNRGYGGKRRTPEGEALEDTRSIREAVCPGP
ncbi:hypothetical protein [Candidatus Nitrososphaera sp. FF02]|uniref:hypothetical protein n=1 Tax=Candidatus Nitrososphaera sp. FF02 TaxID=3398226 RepID=UPI0039E9471E